MNVDGLIASLIEHAKEDASSSAGAIAALCYACCGLIEEEVDSADRAIILSRLLMPVLADWEGATHAH